MKTLLGSAWSKSVMNAACNAEISFSSASRTINGTRTNYTSSIICISVVEVQEACDAPITYPRSPLRTAASKPPIVVLSLSGPLLESFSDDCEGCRVGSSSLEASSDRY